MLNAADQQPPGNHSSLARWIYQTIKLRAVRIKYQLRGNNLHILCEGNPCPDRTAALRWLVPALQQTDINTLIPSHHPPLYQVLLYGRATGQKRPAWTATLYLNQLDHYEAALATRPSLAALTSGASTEADSTSDSLAEAGALLALSNRSLARQGQTTAIACHLSNFLSDLGIAVRVTAKAVPYTPQHAVKTIDAVSPSLSNRLWIVCEAPYSPDPSLFGESLSQALRDLEIEGCRDAVILFQVIGEQQPDWMLRVDLTPPAKMLREWARWGDVEAIQRLLNQVLAPVACKISTATLQESTLHLVCSLLPEARSLNAPSQAQVKPALADLLEPIAPQGIQAAMVYGQAVQQDAPAWIAWVNLPAHEHPALADPALTLAQAGDWEAIAFLLHRLLNPDLEKYLATGGIRLQLLPKGDLLHIMCEASVCPERRLVSTTITRFLQQLRLPRIAGIRLYGRRAGQKSPFWSYGYDFVPRERLVPEVTPEFAASDVYVNDLIPQGDEPILRPDLTPADLQTAWDRTRHRLMRGVEQVLLRSQLFMPSPHPQARTIALPGQVSYQGAKLVMVWGAVGVLLALQTNWMLAQWLQQNQPSRAVAVAPAPAPAASVVSSVRAEPPSPLPSATPRTESTVFNSQGFTQSPAQSNPAQSSSDEPKADAAKPDTLPFTPENPESNQVAAAIRSSKSDLPPFNNPQLDIKLKLYYRYLEQFGTPDILVIGSSRALRGVDPIALQKALADLGYPNVKVFNFGINGATAQMVEFILHRLLTPEQLPRLVLWADGARAFNSSAPDITYNAVLASDAYRQLEAGTLPIPSVTPATASQAPARPAAPKNALSTSLASSYEDLDRWLSDRLASWSGIYADRDRLKHIIQQGLTAPLPPSAAPNTPTPAVVAAASSSTSVNPNTSPNATPDSLDQTVMNQEGFLPLALQFNPATYYQKYAKVTGEYDSDYEGFQITGKQETALRSLLQYTQSRHIPVVFINLPLTEDYLDPARLDYEQTFKQYMVSLAISQPGALVFRDIGQLWTTQYRYFSDPSHLNRYGAYAVSNHLAQDPLIPWSQAKQTPSSQSSDATLRAVSTQ